jgi:hypothetical protein
MVEIGASMRNCLGSKVGEVLLGLCYFFVAEVETAGPIIVEVSPVSTGSWMISAIHGHRHQSVPPEVVHRVVQPLLGQGALVYAATQPEAKKLADMIGVSRWGEFRLPFVNETGEEESPIQFEDHDWAPA